VECYITLGLNGLPGTDILAYWPHSKLMKKMKCFVYGCWGCIHRTLFYSLLANGPNMVECYITLGHNIFPGKDISLMGTFVNYEEMKCCEYGYWGCIYISSFCSWLMNEPNKLECYITLVRNGFPGKDTLA
jgi:hypothetical protein